MKIPKEWVLWAEKAIHGLGLRIEEVSNENFAGIILHTTEGKEFYAPCLIKKFEAPKGEILFKERVQRGIGILKNRKDFSKST